MFYIQVAAQKSFILKTNLPGIFLRSYTIEGEYTLSKHFSVSGSIRIMPDGNLPFKEFIKKQVDISDPDAQYAIENMKVGGNTFTLEGRMYPGKKGYGKGFYTGLYLRRTTHKLNRLPFTVQGGSGNRVVDLEGNMSVTGGGLLLGFQFYFGKRVTFDLQLFGIGAGKHNVQMSAFPSPPLSPAEQTDLQNAINDIEIPGVKITSVVTPNNVNVTGSSVLPMIRSGISLGIRI
ncbi:MAG: DUF3575 domain-containing protein [Chitinophagaceae bacterium]|nr:DUF3575 domain-containing protein [Chitinophagaceae bacterium]